MSLVTFFETYKKQKKTLELADCRQVFCVHTIKKWALCKHLSRLFCAVCRHIMIFVWTTNRCPCPGFWSRPRKSDVWDFIFEKSSFQFFRAKGVSRCSRIIINLRQPSLLLYHSNKNPIITITRIVTEVDIQSLIVFKNLHTFLKVSFSQPSASQKLTLKFLDWHCNRLED